MLDTAPLLPTYRCSLHLRDRSSTALTDNIALVRTATAAEMKQGWCAIHAATLLPCALYLLVSFEAETDPTDRFLRLCASLKAHAPEPIDLHWPVIGPVAPQDMDTTITEIHAMPVTWGLCTRAEDWPYSSLRHGLGARSIQKQRA